MWRKLVEKGYIYLGEHSGWYSKVDECFVPESQLEKTYIEGNPNPIYKTSSGHVVEWVSEENYKFKLSHFAQPLLKWLKENPNVIVPQTRYDRRTGRDYF